MNSSDQGNKQAVHDSNQSQQGNQGYAMSDVEQEMDAGDIGIEGFSYGEVRRVDRHRTEGNRQSSEHGDGASRQGGSEQSSS